MGVNTEGRSDADCSSWWRAVWAPACAVVPTMAATGWVFATGVAAGSGASGESSIRSSEGIRITAEAPPNGEERSVTRIPCWVASRAITKRPRRVSSARARTSNGGGWASLWLASAYSSSLMPSPRSSISTASPLLTYSVRTHTGQTGCE